MPYKLIRNLGHGHSANIEMVEDVNTGSVYARKLFRICGSRDKRKQIFNNEVKVIRRLAPHHHVIRVFATYVAKREVGLILLPVADDGDLEDFLQDFKDRDVAQPKKTKILEASFGCLASGLEFMHRQKVRHKDVKPRNILIHQGSVIYTDFGYSLDHSAIDQSTTTGRPDAFTEKYCAPEVKDWGPRNSKSDIFSLGCVFLEIILALHEGLTPPSINEPYHKILEDGLSRSLLEGLNSLGMITSNMLHLAPEDRFSAETITAILRHYEAGRFCAKCKSDMKHARDMFAVFNSSVPSSTQTNSLRIWDGVFSTTPRPYPSAANPTLFLQPNLYAQADPPGSSSQTPRPSDMRPSPHPRRSHTQQQRDLRGRNEKSQIHSRVSITPISHVPSENHTRHGSVPEASQNERTRQRPHSSQDLLTFSGNLATQSPGNITVGASQKRARTDLLLYCCVCQSGPWVSYLYINCMSCKHLLCNSCIVYDPLI